MYAKLSERMRVALNDSKQRSNLNEILYGKYDHKDNPSKTVILEQNEYKAKKMASGDIVLFRNLKK